ncbi:response regulator [Amycolatopsis azurea]|uniref:DNA-binding response regulator n=1 Tax=Amycolatopsis azurea DSM 43854 TaxID=1238180 RepID=M2P0U6_9PSEU|nr:response regulator transcription factor [Amycolatopsis azurea]EMD28659.1 two component transcriptional regulator, LuxR family [Amycolatopsis azurea DSM 43854]OOC08084.1 DNA-binding response regulator [Amycolatopsis azurea DSM 43854]
MIRVLVAEDMRVVREALVALLNAEEEILVVAQAERGDTVLALAQQTQPDVALLDLGLPGEGGLSVSVKLRRFRPQCKILVLTALDGAGLVREALAVGVHGFLRKSASLSELVDGIKSVHTGQRVISSDLMATATAVGDNPLTRRERSVLRLAAQGMSADQIAAQLCLVEGTVRNHLTRIIAKLDAHNWVDAVHVAERVGWL